MQQIVWLTYLHVFWQTRNILLYLDGYFSVVPALVVGFSHCDLLYSAVSQIMEEYCDRFRFLSQYITNDIKIKVLPACKGDATVVLGMETYDENNLWTFASC